MVTELKFLNKWVFVMGLLWVQTTLGVEVKGLYEIEVVADSRSRVDREKAIREAMKIVLGRVVAAEELMQSPVVKTAVDGAPFYVRQFQFAMAPDGGYTNNQSRLLRIQFDEQQLLELLRPSNVGIWSEIRPETLVWLVVENDGVRQFFNAETMPDVEFAVMRAARLKGLPVIFPMLDLKEQQNISANEVLSADSKHLLKVSERYDVVSVMAGRLVKAGHCWQAEWALYFDQKIKQWVSACGSLNQVVLNGMQGTYERLARYYGVKPNHREDASQPVK